MQGTTGQAVRGKPERMSLAEVLCDDARVVVRARLEGEPLSPSQRDHLLACPACAGELLLVEPFALEPQPGRLDVAWVVRRLEREPTRWRLPVRLVVAAAATLAVALGLPLVPTPPHLPDPQSWSGQRSADLGLVVDGAQLRWAALPGANAYEVHLRLATGEVEPLWRGQLARVDVPEVVALRCGGGVRFDVVVRALDREGRTVGSSALRWDCRAAASPKSSA